MVKTMSIELSALGIVAVFVTLSEILLKKWKEVKECLIEALKIQLYYVMTYILFGIIVPLVCHIPNTSTIRYMVLIVLLIWEIFDFLNNFLKHLEKVPEKHPIPIEIIKIIMEKMLLLLRDFCEKGISNITQK